jgi:hypoxanthine phosphoribosyltransferase
MSGAASHYLGVEAHERDAEEPGVRIVSGAPAEPRQESLPPYRWLLQPDIDRFAHPAEMELARLLTFYGVRWAYEPTTFAVRWGSDGQPREFVTPDFYLPDHDLYLELTTMRQRLVTRKNRKFRLLREQYPNVRVRILYLRDFERLQHAYGTEVGTRHGKIGPVVYAAHDLEARVAGLAEQLVTSWHERTRGEPGARPLLLGAGPGSVRFLASLSECVRALGVSIDHDWVELTTVNGQPFGARVRASRPPTCPILGRHVVVVQEVLSTGLSAVFLEAWLRRQGAAGVEVCALLDREAARVLDVPVACRGFAAPDVALAGYGLARWRAFRDLPFIAEIDDA